MADHTDILLAEYREVFAEVRQAITLQYTALGVGLTLIAVMAKEAADAYLSLHYDVSTSLLLLLPILVVFALVIWAGELGRMRRGSVYLSHLEASLAIADSRSRSDQTYGFHAWLLSSEGKPQLKLQYIVTVITLSMIGIIAIAYASYMMVTYGTSKVVLLLAALSTAFFIIGLALVYLRLKTINNWAVDKNLFRRIEAGIECSVSNREDR